jgi:hypothetical protein
MWVIPLLRGTQLPEFGNKLCPSGKYRQTSCRKKLFNGGGKSA